MKVTIKEDNANDNVKYPCLMKGIHTEVIVYMLKECEGILLTKHDQGYQGELVTNWVMCNFKPFTGSITLSNS